MTTCIRLKYHIESEMTKFLKNNVYLLLNLHLLELFSLESRKVIVFTLLRDAIDLKKLASRHHPIRGKTKTKRDWLAHMAKNVDRKSI